MNRLVLAVVLTVVMASGSVFGQSSSLTYQGQLRQAGVPVSGSFSLDFSLWDADVEGNLVAGAVNRPDTPVSNGLFNVLLDFPPEVFAGARLWLEVSVDGVPLTPRQEITPVPYALSVPGLAANEAGVEVSGDMHATGDVIASAFSSNSPLIFKVNPSNSECARFDDANCFLGLGTIAPQARLHVGGVAGVDGIMFPDGTLQTTAAGNVVGGDSVWSLAGGGGIFYTQGNVGIGTTAPAAKLDIAASGEGAELLRLSTERPWVFRQVHTGSGSALQLRSTVGLKQFEITAAGGANVATFFASDLAGNLGSRVGIGTTLPASKLDIAASGEGAELLRFSTERPWLFRQVRTGPSAGLQLLSTVGIKLFEITAMGGTNVATFVAEDANPRVGIGTTNPTSRLDIVGQDGLGITGFQPFLTLTDNANAGIARGRIQNTNGNIHFFTEASFASGIAPLSLGVGGNAVLGTHSGNAFTAAVFGFSPMFGGNGVIGQADVGSGAYGVWGRSANGVGGYFSGGTYALIADGRARVDILEIAGADVAEKFLSSDENVEPGTVMEIDPEHPGQLRMARESYSTRVAGVVSGAGDIPTGAVLGNLPGHEDAPPIALSGRVWVRCDASKASIAPGDLLTTSETPGHAMKVRNFGKAQGAIIGKAMTPLPQGENGLVLVLVSLQ